MSEQDAQDAQDASALQEFIDKAEEPKNLKAWERQYLKQYLGKEDDDE